MTETTSSEESDYSLEATLAKVTDQYPVTRELLQNLIAARRGDDLLDQAGVAGALVGAVIDLENLVLEQRLDLDDVRIRLEELENRL